MINIIHKFFKAAACSLILASFGFGILSYNNNNALLSSVTNDSANINQNVSQLPDNVPKIDGNQITNESHTKATEYINSMTLSLKTIVTEPQSINNGSSVISGTGWLFDQDTKGGLSYYVATNMHVINDMFYQDAPGTLYKYYFGMTGIGDSLENNPPSSYTQFTVTPKPVFEAINYPNSTDLMVDFGVIEVTFPKPNTATKAFDTKKPKFSDLQPVDCGKKSITVGGYPSIQVDKSHVNFWNQYQGYIDSLYKPYNMIEPKIINNHKYKSGAANYVTSNLNLIPGSSGSMVVDSSTLAIVGIYWGIYTVQGKVEGAYSSLINTYEDKNNNIFSYNLIADYRDAMITQGKHTYITDTENIEDLYFNNKIRNIVEAKPLVAIWVLLGVVAAIIILSIILGLVFYGRNRKNNF